MTPPDEELSSRPLPDLIGGRYRIVSRLGVGGMGVVYKANDIQLNRAVAIKALEERRLNIPGAAMRLRTEALAAASLDHPYICKVYELVETPTDTYIVMEYIEGETLASMLKRGVLPLMQALQLGREIAEGLANAHDRGLVHRDVKPSNVMVTTHGHVKLLDFGVAGADVESTSRDITRTLSPQVTVHAGTPQYMAPEQAAGSPITTRADLFSLGVVLYECLTAKLPFSGSTTFDYVRHVMQSPPKRLDKVAPETPADLVELIDRLLEKTPADRPESADTVVKRLQQLEDAFTAPAGDIRTARQARAGRRWKAVAVAAVAVAAIALSWRFIWPSRSDDVQGQLRPFVTTAAIESGSRISPDGEWVSFISRAGGTTRIMVQRVDGGEARPLTLGPGLPLSQVWAPDGKQIAVVVKLDEKPVLQIYPAFFGGEPALTAALPDGIGADLVRWIGRDIYLRTSTPGVPGIAVRRISLESPSAVVSISEAWKIDGTLQNADVRPDARSAVIGVSRNNQEDLWTLNLDGSALRQLTADAYFDKDPLWIGDSGRVVFQSNRGGQVDLWQIDTRTKAVTSLTSSEAEEIAESTSTDGRIVSFRQLTKDASLWQFAGASQQLTQDSLSDYAPVLSGDGRTLAFQRSQPTPSRGYTILDAKIFISPFEGGQATGARAIADAFAPDLSYDGRWLAYLQPGDPAPRTVLTVRDLRGGTTATVSRSMTPPSLTTTPRPVDFVARTTAWSRSGDELFFVDWPDAMVVRRYRAVTSEVEPPLMNTAGSVLRDLYVSSETGRLGYISAPAGLVSVHELDPVTNAVREIARFKGTERGLAIAGRGWMNRQFVVLRTVRSHDDGTGDLEILVTSDNGNVKVVASVPNAFGSTARLHAAERAIYLTRSEKGTDNVYVLSLATGNLTQVTQNTLPGVKFSGLQPVGSRGVIGVREERREDIWLIQQTATPRTGNPAGR
ncbi:MAG TPA: protein kinase [Vicinamibacterales bacterium]|nr:protein kinase [Vicinamibacterales bacterium]